MRSRIFLAVVSMTTLLIVDAAKAGGVELAQLRKKTGPAPEKFDAPPAKSAPGYQYKTDTPQQPQPKDPGRRFQPNENYVPREFREYSGSPASIYRARGEFRDLHGEVTFGDWLIPDGFYEIEMRLLAGAPSEERYLFSEGNGDLACYDDVTNLRLFWGNTVNKWRLAWHARIQMEVRQNHLRIRCVNTLTNGQDERIPITGDVEFEAMSVDIRGFQ